MRLMTLMVETNELTKRNSQFIIATHSPILMSMPNADIPEFSPSGISKVDYRDTEHFRVTKSFMDNHERMLRYLFE